MDGWLLAMSLPGVGDRVCHCTAASPWASFPARQVEATFQQCPKASLSAIWRVCGWLGRDSGEQTGWPAGMMNEHVFQDLPFSLPPTAATCRGLGQRGGRERPRSQQPGSICLCSVSCSALRSSSSGAKLKNCGVFKELFY